MTSFVRLSEYARNAVTKEYVHTDIIGEIILRAKSVPQAMKMIEAAIEASRTVGIAHQPSDWGGI